MTGNYGEKKIYPSESKITDDDDVISYYYHILSRFSGSIHYKKHNNYVGRDFWEKIIVFCKNKCPFICVRVWVSVRVTLTI